MEAFSFSDDISKSQYSDNSLVYGGYNFDAYVNHPEKQARTDPSQQVRDESSSPRYGNNNLLSMYEQGYAGVARGPETFSTDDSFRNMNIQGGTSVYSTGSIGQKPHSAFSLDSFSQGHSKSLESGTHFL